MALNTLKKLFINNYEKTSNKTTNYILKSTNIYLVVLLANFTFNSCLTFLYYGNTLITSINFIMIAYLFFLLLFKKKEIIFGINLKIYVIFIYLLQLSYISFFSYYTDYIYKLDYYYFSIISSIPFLFDLKKDKTYIFTILLFSSFFIVAPTLLDFNFTPKHSFIGGNPIGDKIIKSSHILFSSLFHFMNVYMISRKENYINKIRTEKAQIEENFTELDSRYKDLMKKQLVRSNMKYEDIDELIQLAETNSTTYFHKFCESFPLFRNELLVLNPSLTYNDLYFCSLMKLNFDTKKIARVLDLSVRAVESKKYRLKKKIDPESVITIQEYILSI